MMSESVDSLADKINDAAKSSVDWEMKQRWSNERDEGEGKPLTKRVRIDRDEIIERE